MSEVWELFCNVNPRAATIYQVLPNLYCAILPVIILLSTKKLINNPLDVETKDIVMLTCHVMSGFGKHRFCSPDKYLISQENKFKVINNENDNLLQP